MDETGVAKTYTFGDKSTCDIIVSLENQDGRAELIYSHSTILTKASKYFANCLSNDLVIHQALNSLTCIKVFCPGYDRDHYIKLLKLLYLPRDLVLECLDSVKMTVGVLQAAIALECEEVTHKCIQYLEASPWDEKEEEDILKIIPRLGEVAMPILARIQPVEPKAAKHVFLSAIHLVTSNDISCPPFTDELKTSAQEQIEYMLAEDEDMPLIIADDDIKSDVKDCFHQMFNLFDRRLNCLASEPETSLETAESNVLHSLSDIEWMCSILPKMDLMEDFASSWVNSSVQITEIVGGTRFEFSLWGVKLKVIEIAGNVFEAVGYGNAIIPTASRVNLLKAWLPFIRKVKPLLDSKCTVDENFPYKMDTDLCQLIEGAIVSMILSLPSNDQAEFLTNWLKIDEVKYPDLSEAFEVWCYRTKTAKRRLSASLDCTEDTTITH